MTIMTKQTTQSYRGAPPAFEVTVWDEDHPKHRRTYAIRAKNDRVAANRGANLFLKDIPSG